MMEKIFISVEKSSRMVSLTKKYIGNDLESLQQELVFKFTDSFVEGSARLEYQIGSNKYHIPMTRDGESYIVPIKNVLTKEGKIPMQLVVVQVEQDEEIPVFKSNVFEMFCNKSINAQTEAPDDYEYWLDIIQTKLNAFEEGLEELDSAITEINNLDLVLSDKVDGNVTVTLTKKDSTTKTVTLSDGISLMFHWDGTRLGIKTERDENYTYVDLQGCQGERGETGAPFRIKKTYSTIQLMIEDYDNMSINDYVMIDGNIEESDNAKLFVKQETEDPTYKWHYLADFSGATGIKGETGVTPNIQIGDVTSGNTPSVTRIGTNENPIFNFTLEKGEKGDTGDVNLSQLNAEISARTNADNNLQSQINGVASGSPLVASSTSEMTDTTRVYVNTTDGKWYYYDGDSWEIGGTYQSTGIDNNSININMLSNEIKNDNNINLINPSLCVDNSAPRSADGVISDNNNYWRTDYILLPANTNYLLTLQENNNIGSNFLASRCYYYDENKTYINSSSNSQPNNNTENDLYVIIGLNKELITYENRFKLMMSKGSIRKKFTPNTELNKNNINMDIKYNDLNVEILKNLNNLPNFEYEVGTISSSSGNNTTSTARIRTKNYYYINKISQIKVLNDYVKFWIYKYDDNFNSYSYEQLTNDYIINESGWYRLIFAFKNNREITNDNINELISSFNIVSSNDIVNNIINKNINYSNSLLYAGEKLDFNLINYEQQTFRNYVQDSCYYNNKLFSFNSEGIFKVYDFFTKETVNDCYLAEYATIKPHCNSACFGNEFYNSSDKFPLLYVNAYNTADLPLGTCYVHRIIESNNTYTSNLVQTIQIGFTNDEIWTISGDTRPYGNFVVDTDNNYLYVYTLRGNNTRFFKFNLPVLNNGSSIILTTNDIIEYFDIEFMPFIQGCTYYNNKIYLVNGNNSSISNSSSLNAIDLLKKEISTHINISSLNNEPEAIFFKDTLYIAGNGGYFRKLIQ